MPSAYADMKKLGDNTYYFSSDYYVSLVVVGEDGVLIVDPANAERAKKLKLAVAKITSKPITHIALTHEHYDHVGGTEIFKGAAIVCQMGCQPIFDLDVLDLTPKKVTLSYSNKLEIDLGGDITTELHFFGAGDGAATSVIYVPSDGVVATGDLYRPKGLTNGDWIDDQNMLGVRRILNEISKWNLKHAINGHSENTSVQALLESRDYFNDLFHIVKKEVDKIIIKEGVGAVYGKIDADVFKNIELPAYQKWDGYKTSLPGHVSRMVWSIIHGG